MKLNKGLSLVLWLLITTLLVSATFAQETTAGLQGTVKDPQGAVVSKATVEINSPALIGTKKLQTDSGGYYRFANLPPGTYTVTVTAAGFRTLKQSGLTLEVGKLPTVDLSLQVGGSEQTVEVSSEAPVIDVTTTKTQTNITEDQIAAAPQGRSFQSIVQFAPGARNEPLQGLYSGTNGVSIDGAAQNESTYLIEGQDTSSAITGTSNANTPFEFAQEVQIKSTGIEAEHAGALGGVVNVVQKRGSNSWHGQFWTYYEPSAVDAGPNPYIRQDPTAVWDPLTSVADIPYQKYSPLKDHSQTIQPGFDIGGPIKKDRLWLYLAYAPEYFSLDRAVQYGDDPGSDPKNPQPTGLQKFSQTRQTYYTTARLDYLLTQKIRVFGSWLYQYSRESGKNLPGADSKESLLNGDVGSPINNWNYQQGYVAPNQLFNVGSDITITPSLVATTRFGHFFSNYADRGYPNSVLLYWRTSGIGASALDGSDMSSTAYGQNAGYSNYPFDEYYTKDTSVKNQFTQDLAWFKKGFGTHNIKGGFQFNYLKNDTDYQYHDSLIRFYPGLAYKATGATGQANCAAIRAFNQLTYGTPGGSAASNTCSGNYGYLRVREFATVGAASSNNYGLYIQDAWTMGKGFTLNIGLRSDKEYLPKYPNATEFVGNPINFGFGQKLAPRIGAAWDVFRDGKMKVFGSYGKFFDQMKLNLARGSFGGDYWHDCMYANYTDPSQLGTLIPQRNGTGNHYCTGSGDATWLGGSVPASLAFIENIDLRSSEGVDPHIKPYQQHESVFGVDYQLSKNWALEARWDRRRLDHVIEDAGLLDANSNENFSIVNPGEGIDATVNGCAACPPNIKAARSYDGIEFRVTKSVSQHWFGMFSYTYSKLRGNYAGLTNSDQSDTATPGRTDPNNNRSFDEPYFEYTAEGKPFNGLLATDRPHALKASMYYRLPFKRTTTTLGWFQVAYSGTPLSSYMDVGIPGGYPVYLYGHGNWVDVTQDAQGLWTASAPHLRRTPAFTQSDARLTEDFKISNTHETWVVGFETNVTNVLNQRAAVAYWSNMNSPSQGQAIVPGDGSYAAEMHAYDWLGLANSIDNTGACSSADGTCAPGLSLDSRYGKPNFWQSGRTVRFKIRFDF
jgi:outer membrane receptor protein involved in Fe transport